VEHQCELREFLARSAGELDINLTNEQIEQFMLYLDQLLQWNRTTNLTSITDPYEIIGKHFVDSLVALEVAQFLPHAILTDVGAGAGFPGVPLKIVRNDLHLILIEPVQKKCSFLLSIIGTLKLENVSVFTGAFRQYLDQEHLLSDFLVVRALRFEEIEEQVLSGLKPGGKIILYRTEKLQTDSLDRRLYVETEKSFSLPMDYGSRVISVLGMSATA
jgi:16S rRNA (guanine527-N7)-methyltransferase